MTSPKQRITVASRSRRERLLAPEATELLERAGFGVSVEIEADGEDAEHRVEALLDALAPASVAHARLQQLAALGEIGAGVTHETRNVLTAIIGFTQLARQRTDPDASRRHLEMIEREALRCVEILDRFLSFARVDESEPERVDVGQVLEQVINATRHHLGMNRITSTLDLAPELPRVRCARGALTQVVLNLMLNAMHATPAGGTVTVTARAIERAVEIRVTDTGPGVPPELHERIFEAFFTTKPSGQGTGLGLALCRRLVTAAGGSIAVESGRELGGGASFVIVLPAEPAP